MAGIALSVQGIGRSFVSRGRRVTALDNFDLEIEAGEFLCLVGPSGCGKSTLLNMISGLMEPSAGQILFRGQPIRGIDRAIGYVMQEDNLLPWRSLCQNVEAALEIRGVSRTERRRRAMELIGRVGLKGFENNYPHELSGGMRQRANIIRTLAYDPEVILMDEPFGPLDALTRNVLQSQLLELWSQSGKTVIFVTHDLSEAITLADRVVIMSHRPGRVKAIQRVEIPRPRNVFEVHKTQEFQTHFDQLLGLLLEELRGGVFDYVGEAG